MSLRFGNLYKISQMHNIKSFIYDRLSNDAELKESVVGIFPNYAQDEEWSPVIIYSRISETQTNWVIRNALYQISVRWDKLLENEQIKDRIVWLFNRYKSDWIHCSIQAINESYDKELKQRWIHLTVKFKLVDKNF